MKKLYLSLLTCLSTYLVYAQPGSLNTAFGGGAVVATLGTDARANAICVQPDGKVLMAGVVYTTSWDYGLTRYNQDGTLDLTFGNNGIIITDINGGVDYARAVVVQPDGKIIMGGYATMPGDNSDFCLIRYNSNGTVDSSFGNSGKAITHVSANERLHGMVLQPDGRIIAIGHWQTFSSSSVNSLQTLLVRYNGNGTIDSTFGFNGISTNFISGASCIGNAMTRTSDGKIVVAGGVSLQQWNFAATRYTSSGSLDSSFGTNGSVINNAPNEQIANAVAVQTDGKIIVGGRSMILLRYNADGTKDNLFGTAGKVQTTFSADGGYGEIRGITLQPDGKILVTGYARFQPLTSQEYDIVVVRYNIDGSLDHSFGTNGIVRTALALYDYGEAIVLHGGKIFVAGNTQPTPCYSGTSCGQQWVALSYNTEATVLPVNQLSFTAILQEGHVRLNWATTNGDLDASYQIERSNDARNFVFLGEVAARNYNSDTYGFTDVAPGDVNYYRIRCKQKSGAETFSKILVINTKNKALITISPNPARTKVNVQLKGVSVSEIHVIDVYGRIMKTVRLAGANNVTATTLDVSGLVPGVYFIKAGDTTVRLMVEK